MKWDLIVSGYHTSDLQAVMIYVAANKGDHEHNNELQTISRRK